MFNPQTAPTPAEAPAPSTAPSPPEAPTPRFAYLIARLRNRQITMEEATELFQFQQTMIARLRIPPPPPPPPPTGTRPASMPPGGLRAPTPLALSIDDWLWLGFLGMGAGAGLFAALLKRSAAGKTTAETPPTDVSSATGSSVPSQR